jgi:predicted ArsR family transcriptional regulator
MKFVLEPSDQSFLEQLHRLGSATVSALCEEIGVTATAVRQRLTRLHSLGLVSREKEKADRGRPHHVYSLTVEGLRHLGNDYRELAMILWQEIKALPDSQLRSHLLGRIREAMVSRFEKSVRSDSVADRFRELQHAMSDNGYQVEVDFDGSLPILRETSCPYQDLASMDPSICELEQEVFRDVLKTPVELTQCCLDGHTCCEFQAASQEQGASG